MLLLRLWRRLGSNGFGKSANTDQGKIAACQDWSILPTRAALHRVGGCIEQGTIVMNPSLAKSHLIVHTKTPYNAEPTLERLRVSLTTAQNDFYVRSHGNIPHLDAAVHRLRVSGQVTTPLESVRSHLLGLQSFRSINRTEA